MDPKEILEAKAELYLHHFTLHCQSMHPSSPPTTLAMCIQKLSLLANRIDRKYNGNTLGTIK